MNVQKKPQRREKIYNIRADDFICNSITHTVLKVNILIELFGILLLRSEFDCQLKYPEYAGELLLFSF